MKGLELSKKYYETFGEPMLRESFPHLLPHLAVGMVGAGSDAMGFDDETSRDHDFGPGFAVFLPGEEIVSRRDAFLLERAYAKLPDEFMGFRREKLSPVGGSRFGVLRLDEFLEKTVGSKDGTLSLRERLLMPEQYLLEATDGELFYDGSGEFSKIRDSLRKVPADVRLKKAAGYLVLLAQSGAYNFERTLRHGEPGAAALSLSEFSKAALHLLYVLNNAFMPYYKWAFRGAEGFDGFSPDYRAETLLSDVFTLLTTGFTETETERKREILKRIENAAKSGAAAFLKSVKPEGARFDVPIAANPYRLNAGTESEEKELEKEDIGRVAEALNRAVSDGELRNLHILAGGIL